MDKIQLNTYSTHTHIHMHLASTSSISRDSLALPFHFHKTVWIQCAPFVLDMMLPHCSKSFLPGRELHVEALALLCFAWMWCAHLHSFLRISFFLFHFSCSFHSQNNHDLDKQREQQNEVHNKHHFIAFITNALSFTPHHWKSSKWNINSSWRQWSRFGNLKSR